MNKLYIVIFLSLLLTTFACENDTDSAEPITSVEIENDQIRVTKKQFETSNFELGEIGEHSFAKDIPVSGTINLPQKSKAIVSSFMSGTVGTIDLIEGEWVKKGRTLFTVTNPELIALQEDYLLTQGDLKYKRSEVLRLKDLLAEKLTTVNELTKINSEINQFETRVAALEKKLRLYGLNPTNISTTNLSSVISIVAPISGFVSNINAIKGMYLESAQPAIELSNTLYKFLELNVLEKDIKNISKGQNIQFSIQSHPAKVYKATVHLINKLVNENHMIQVHCHLEDKDKDDLVPGMFATAKIITDNYKSTALKDDAIINLGDKSYVLKLNKKDSKYFLFDKIEINSGHKENGFTEVKTNFPDDTQFLTKGAYFLIME